MKKKNSGRKVVIQNKEASWIIFALSSNIEIFITVLVLVDTPPLKKLFFSKIYGC